MGVVRRLATKPFVVMPTIAVLLLVGWWFFRPDDGAESTDAAAGEQVVEATIGSMTETVTAEGTLAYAESDDLSFSAAGTVTSVNVEAGQQVREGDVLATLDSPELEAAVAAAETAVAEAEARLADDLAAGASDAQIAADESNLGTAEDQLVDAQEALEGAQLVAPFDGAVSTVDLVEGEELGSGGSSGTSPSGTGTGSGSSASTLGSGETTAPGGTAGGTGSSTTSAAQIQIVSAGRFVVEVGFDDTDIVNVTEGQEATISLSSSSSGGGFPGGGGGPPGFGGGGAPGGGFPGGGGGNDEAEEEGTGGVNSDVEAATGSVTEVSGVADASSGVATYPVTIEFSDESGDYNAGATVLVELAYGDPTETVQVPSLAVVTADDGATTVTVRTSDGDETRSVTTGETSGTMVAITSGLEAGEQVVVSLPGAGRGGGGFPGGGGGGAGPNGVPGAAGEEDS